MGGSNKGNSTSDEGKGDPGRRDVTFSAAGITLRKTGLLIEIETILKEVHLPPFYIF